jgi:hypothetical protein
MRVHPHPLPIPIPHKPAHMQRAFFVNESQRCGGRQDECLVFRQRKVLAVVVGTEMAAPSTSRHPHPTIGSRLPTG